MELTIAVTIDKSIDLTVDLVVPRGSRVLDLKQQLAALDPTGNAQASSFAVGKSPKSDGEVVQPLDDAVELTEEHTTLDVCPVPPPAPPPEPQQLPQHHQPDQRPPSPVSSASATAAGLAAGPDAAREAARLAAKAAQAARKEREAAAAQAKAEAEARKKAETEAARQRLLAQAQAAGPGHSPSPSPHIPAQAAPSPIPAATPTLAGVPIVEDDGETRVKGVSADGRFVFAYVGTLKHPHDILALVELFKGEASLEDLQRNRARFVYAGGTQDKATSVQVQKEVIIEATGLEKGDYELASFAHDNPTRQLNRHLTKDNCVVMFGGKCLKIVAQHGV